MILLKGKARVMQSLMDTFSVKINDSIDGKIDVEKFARQIKPESSKLKHPEQVEKNLERIEREIY